MIVVVRRLWMTVLGAALVVVCLAAGAAVRSVAATPQHQGLLIALPAHSGRFTHSPDGPLLSTQRMAPGRSASGIMGVRNDSGGSAQVLLSAVHSHVTDECGGCSADRYQRIVRFVIETSSQRSSGYTRVWAGTADGLARGVRLTALLDDEAVRWVRLTTALPRSADNNMQRDDLRFGLRVSMDAGALGTSIVTVGEHHGADGVRIAGLAVTGTELRLVTAIALALLVAGSIVTVLGRRGRSRHQTVE